MAQRARAQVPANSCCKHAERSAWTITRYWRPKRLEEIELDGLAPAVHRRACAYAEAIAEGDPASPKDVIGSCDLQLANVTAQRCQVTLKKENVVTADQVGDAVAQNIVVKQNGQFSARLPRGYHPNQKILLSTH